MTAFWRFWRALGIAAVKRRNSAAHFGGLIWRWSWRRGARALVKGPDRQIARKTLRVCILAVHPYGVQRQVTP